MARLRDLGATGDADRLARRLREYGVDTRRAGRGGRPSYGDRLSPRELEVVRMLVTGRTDREIAEALFLSPRTVGAHLESARRKVTMWAAPWPEIAVLALVALAVWWSVWRRRRRIRRTELLVAQAVAKAREEAREEAPRGCRGGRAGAPVTVRSKTVIDMSLVCSAQERALLEPVVAEEAS